MSAALIPLRNARVRLLVRHVESGAWVRNGIVSRGLRDAVQQARSTTERDWKLVAMVAVNESVIGMYVRGLRERYAFTQELAPGTEGAKFRRRLRPVPLPPELRTVPAPRARGQRELAFGPERKVAV